MAGGMRKMAVYLGLVEDDAEHYEDYQDYAEDYDDAPAPVPARAAARPVREVDEPAPAPRREPSRLGADLRKGSTALGTEGSLATVHRAAPEPAAAYGLDRITTIHPRSYNDAKQIGESFRSGTPVIMNLTDMDDADAKRLVDFAAGLIFGLRGTIERVTSKVFLLSPANVSVTAEERARMAENGFFNQS
ncbi:cell division inhibitor SepF [Motilibacter rhizosphaerae]|uniref:Cell division protein SepF n=1 Tax=Motilibacter rhizosphaerae TaxID=598652 RepID=A0A4Q7NHI1_9ACTN|nr:cell division protein SepF [Motilibacter rhizosphaerae]RZS82906.1 cell division inhibitor SepF [Motilibacter rhizosphaerae]